MIDITWKNMHTERVFLFINNSSKLDQVPNIFMSIFDVKTKTHMSNAYHQINWDLVEAKTHIFE